MRMSAFVKHKILYGKRNINNIKPHGLIVGPVDHLSKRLKELKRHSVPAIGGKKSSLIYITFSDILYYSKRNKAVIDIRDNMKGGALTETTLLVLLSVYRPNHGYGIMQFIEKETNGRVILGAGTLYGAINALLKKRWISRCENGADTTNRNKKEYAITDAGRHIVGQELKRLSEIQQLAYRIIGG